MRKREKSQVLVYYFLPLCYTCNEDSEIVVLYMRHAMFERSILMYGIYIRVIPGIFSTHKFPPVTSHLPGIKVMNAGDRGPAESGGHFRGKGGSVCCQKKKKKEEDKKLGYYSRFLFTH